jgi:16S rRNA (guanine966-N2)-methyltransferase
MANNEVRIIGGQWKGRKLKFPARPDLRPTLGRVRETLFNWLAPFIAGTRCLDLYAGSGALGFEALSRGAVEVTFVEQDRKAAAALKTNATLFFDNRIDEGNLDERKARIRNETAGRFLDRDTSRFDLVFFDPPFADRGSATILERLFDQHLSPDALVYLEAPKRSPLPVGGLPFKRGTAGDCQFMLIRAP